MPIYYAYVFTLIGVIISIFLPSIWKWAFNPEKSYKGLIELIKNALTKPAVRKILFASVIAIVVVMIFDDEIITRKVAFMNGLCWQSVLARIGVEV